MKPPFTQIDCIAHSDRHPINPLRCIQCSNQVPTIVYQSSALNGKLQHLHGAARQATASNDPHSTKLSDDPIGASISDVSADGNSNGNSNGNSTASSIDRSLSDRSSADGSFSSPFGGSSSASSAASSAASSTASSRKNSTAGKMSTLLDYYPDAQGDGIHLSWDHAVNSQSLLEQSLSCKSPRSFPWPFNEQRSCYHSAR